ncbi:MAG: S8 family serine peptidase [Planctomycetota bacterium]
MSSKCHQHPSFVCLFLIVIVLTAFRTAVLADDGPEGPGFYDASGFRAVRVSTSEFVVCTSRPRASEPQMRPANLPPLFTPDELHPAAVTLEERLARRGLHVVRNVGRETVDALDGVSFVLPLLYPSGSDVPIYPSNRVIVALQSAAGLAQLEQVAFENNCRIKKCKWGENRFILTVLDTRSVDPLALANTLHEMTALVLYAHPDFFLPKIAYAPPVINDPLYLSLQWHLDGDTAKGADANSDINVETAWDTDNGPTAQGSPTVRVSILDECVEKLHPDLFPNWAAGLDLDNDPPDDDPSPDAGQRHGTSCAGVAVAAGNTIGVRGAAPACGLIGVKFFGASISEMADGFYFSVDPDDNGNHSDGAAVLSNSWGFADGTLQPPDVVNAINFAATSGRNGLGCLVLFASANNDHTVNGVSALCQLLNVMGVGGTNSHAMHTEFSDVGPEVGITTPTNDRGDDGVRFSWLDITTTDNTGSSGYNGLPDLDYTDEFGGTSSATPLAAGVLALIISQDETMTAAQARAILQHTAVRLDEPYGRFDGVTGHSHRFGFGRADAGAAVAAARAGLRWPDRIRTLTANPTGNDITLTWSTPLNNYSGSLLVRSDKPFAWMPTDGETYTVSQIVAPGVQVVHNDTASIYVDVAASSGAFFYGVYPRSAGNLYGFGAKAHLIRDGITLFYDNSESADPGWSHGGAGDEWTRGTPTSANSIFGQEVVGSGPLAGLRGTRAIGGNVCWGTDLATTYDSNSNAYLQTPLINLTGVTAPVFLEYWDWCLLETFYDICTVEVVDAGGNLLGYLDDDTGGDYDWTQRVYDLTPFAGQAVRIRFRLVSDSLFERDGWFLDEVRVTVAANIPLPPTAEDVYAETTENTPVGITLIGADPNPGTTLSYIITTLPAHGDLHDPNGGQITLVPYTLLSEGNVVNFDSDTDYQGSDAFTYRAFDGALQSNDATADVSIGTPLLAYDFPLDVDPGWLAEPDWAFGVPLGSGGDPTAGYSGTKVYGYNLAGQYTDDLPQTHLTTLPMNCSGLSRVTLDFARWLGVEAASYDDASVAVTNDGVEWHTVWSHTGGDLQETAWSLQSYNVGEVADDQPFVQFRWTMGATDGNTTFSGWNIDDIQVWAIGTPVANQPPLAERVVVSTPKNTALDVTLVASDQNEDPLEYVILDLPPDGTLSDPNGSTIVTTPYTLLTGGNVVSYQPDTDFVGDDVFHYAATDGLLLSNAAPAEMEVIESAAFPFTEDFEAGSPLALYWSTFSTSAGRVRVTDQDGPIGVYHVTMDSGRESTTSANELTLAIDLEGESIVLLRYDWKDYGDEANALPDSWVGSTPGDGVAISADGITWHKVANLFDPAARGDGYASEDAEPRAADYQTVTIDLDAAAASAGIPYTKTFRIRFQQYDNNPIPTDGVAIDNVNVLQGTGDPIITTPGLPDGRLGEPYGPFAMAAAGGDLPLVWFTPIEFFEESLGESQFQTVGIAQGWQDDDAAFDYTLPFVFPFYGEQLTAVKVATDGWINFGSYVGSTYANSEILLAYNKRIAPLWDDLRTDQGGDIYIDESITGQVTFRWDAVTRSGLYPCNFSATLFEDGRIQFDYGTGNTPITATVGVSSGDQERYFLSSYDAQPDLGGVDSLILDYSRLPPGLIMDSEGVITGTPTTLGVWHPIFVVEDASQRTDSKQLALAVTDDLYGDFDGDDDVDDFDFSEFKRCYTGDGGGPVEQDCQPGDSDGDTDIDCTDWLAFEQAFFNSAGYLPIAEMDEFLGALVDPTQDEVFRCIADMNHDGGSDGLDIQPYADALLGF